MDANVCLNFIQKPPSIIGRLLALSLTNYQFNAPESSSYNYLNLF